jgi:SRSO17 transposase
MGTVKMRSDWERELVRFSEPFVAALGHKARRRWAPLYLQGLLGPGERKSVQPMAARLAPEDHEQLHHFIATSHWDLAPLEQALVRAADRLVGGAEAYLILDDTSLIKQGRHSVGVARQYCGALGKRANCQTLVSLTLARGEVPVPIGLRLYLPQEWTAQTRRLKRAHVPPEARAFQPKWQIALEELDRVRMAGAHFGSVLADAAYGTCGAFRAGLSTRGLIWAVGVLSTQKVYPEHVRECWPRPNRRRGRPRKHPQLSHRACSVAQMIDRSGRFRTLSWRMGTKGSLQCEFAAVRVRMADGPPMARGQHRPGEKGWLVCERRGSGEHKYYLTNHPPQSALRQLASAIKARWVCEQAHQQLKEELGLDHFEGRSWLGLHHHALFTMIAMAFLQHLRLRPGRGGGKNRTTPTRPAAAAHPARRTPRLPRSPREPTVASLSTVPHARGLPSA